MTSSLQLRQALRVLNNPTIAFAGAGGKTTALFHLARELNFPVIVTATTHLGEWQIPLADRHIATASSVPVKELEHGLLAGVILITGPINEERTSPISGAALKWLHEYTGSRNLPLLIEADGARQKPLKAPAEHEPAIPDFVDHVVVVAGLSGLGKPLANDMVHRPEVFSTLSGLDRGEIITPEALTRVLTHKQGGLKNIPPAPKRTVILNQADTAEAQSQAASMSPALLKVFDAVIVATLLQKEIHAVHEKTAGIILAAGASTRFGQPKQLLDWHGQPFVRAVAKTALSAGLSPIIVVTGANAEQVENALTDLDVITIRNESWQDGQSTSLRAGLSSLAPSALSGTSPKSAGGDSIPHPPPPGKFVESREEVGSAIFLLADQPHIRTDVILSLMEVHARGLHPIVVPLVLEERRANPVLFDKVTFPDLLKLEGDVGGRALFSKYRVEFMPWHDDSLLLDVDKPEDYQRLLSDDAL